MHGRRCAASIYRFPGADVNVYEAHKEAMRADEVGALYVELTKNFRSHGDVLSFVDRVFEAVDGVRQAFMSLEAERAAPLLLSGQRAAHRPRAVSCSPRANASVRATDAKRAGAEAIARRFAALRMGQPRSSDMVVLLGKMSRAGMYAGRCAPRASKMRGDGRVAVRVRAQKCAWSPLRGGAGGARRTRLRCSKC